jgi:hypothetical protein
MVPLSEGCIVVLHKFQEYRIQGLFVRQSSVATKVKLVLVHAVLDNFSEFKADDQIIVTFIQVYDSEAVDEGVAWLFFDHGIHYLLPSMKAIAAFGCISNNCVVELPK